MRPWDVIEGALARKKPPRDQAWLARELDISEQGVSNWKSRGVPRAQYERLADILGLTMEQVAGREPPPWERTDAAWPFQSIDRSRYDRLNERMKGEIEGKVREQIERLEQLRLGESLPFPPNNVKGGRK